MITKLFSVIFAILIACLILGAAINDKNEFELELLLSKKISISDIPFIILVAWYYTTIFYEKRLKGYLRLVNLFIDNHDEAIKLIDDEKKNKTRDEKIRYTAKKLSKTT